MSDVNELTDPLICTHCGNKAPMQIKAKYDEIEWQSAGERECFGYMIEEGRQIGYVWELLKCPSCNNILLFRYVYEPSDGATEETFLYPKASEQIYGLPEDVSRAYTEAQKIKRHSNSFGIQLGRVLEFVCLDKEAKGNNLKKKLKDMADREIIPKQLADMGDAMREFRNFGAHANPFQELTEKEVPILEALIKAILEYVYSAPALIQEAQSRIDEFNAKPERNNS